MSPVGEVSPDGKWIWDGSAWQPNEPSPAAQPRVSDDGRFYWDGARWAPMPAATSPATAEPLVLAKLPGTVVTLFPNRIEVETGIGLKKRETILLRAITDVTTKSLFRGVVITMIDGKKRTLNASDPAKARAAILDAISR